jgi:hypothetical protein
LKAKPEPTQLEHLSDASFLGKLLVLPANVRLDWKVTARYKCSSLFGLVVRDKGKKFYNFATRGLLPSATSMSGTQASPSGTNAINLFEDLS